MRCDEIREQMIDFIYDEGSVLPVDGEIEEHIRTCSACREEIEELKRARRCLQLWKDEPPLRSVTIARREKHVHRNIGLRCLGYAAIAAMVFMSFLALTNAHMSWDKNGFSFSTHLSSPAQVERDYYTKAEVRNIMKEAFDYTNETNYLMMRKLMDSVEQDRWNDMRLIRDQVARNRN
jgi:hypothetical protein